MCANRWWWFPSKSEGSPDSHGEVPCVEEAWDWKARAWEGG